MRQFFKNLFFAVLGTIIVLAAMSAIAIGGAYAHTGSPSPTTWSTGNTLTASNLNDTIAHIHNTLSGGIVDAHLSTSAAISHSKLARPGLVPKAVLFTTSACAGAGAAGTDCTTGVEYVQFIGTSGGAGTGNSALEANGAAGSYLLTLNYTPTDTNFGVIAQSMTTQVFCTVTGRATTAPHITIDCENDASADTDANLTVTVFDTN